MGIIWIIVVGFVAGILARLLAPGPNKPSGFLLTTVLGIAQMCLIFKIIYACGHRDVIKAPCEWRDEGRINILGKRVPCGNSTRNLADLTRYCMACSPDPAGQDLIDLNSPNAGNDVESYISRDEKDVMAIIVRNESHLRKRAEISRVALSPAMSFGFPTTSELHYQCCVNEEFLARRLRRFFRPD